MRTVVEKLLSSQDPSVRFRVLVNVLDRNLNSPEIERLRLEIIKEGCTQLDLWGQV